ncbi:DUF3800 domain-containing protein [Propionivibrio sp.]|uniref:DUF3800 domain-containing protein n=1 Tax=Propionivibrio sp. TaxID=2212460 RepID=UPI003BF14491
MFVYVDETGNTGDNIFDGNQPFFVTAALITKTNFDMLQRLEVQRIASSLGVEELHAAELGIGRLSQVAREILAVLKSCDARFSVSRVEKMYLAATKVFDTVFDNHENPAVPWHVYNFKNLRLIMLFKLVEYVFDADLLQCYWESLMCRSENRGSQLFADACCATLRRLEALPDARSREITRAAFSWAAENPRQITVHSSTDRARFGHLPNVVGFLNLMEGVEELSNRWRKPVRSITHDRQSQFEKTLAYWHDILSHADPTPIQWPVIPSRKLQKVFGSKFVISNARDSAGIQIVDVVMWLFQRLNRGDDIGFECAALMDYAFAKGTYSDFSFDGAHGWLEKEMKPVMEADMSEEQLQYGRDMVEKMNEGSHDLPDYHSMAASRMFAGREEPTDRRPTSWPRSR